MSRDCLRLVHASDLHLEQPLYGLPEPPDHLRDVFLEAPYLAAERVFETALAERADLLVLAGDVVHPQRGGPRALEFLCEQFARLDERGIRVCWAGGVVDPPQAWPQDLALPGNVTVFPTQRVGHVPVLREGKLAAHVIGLSRGGRKTVPAAEFERTDASVPTIAVAHGVAEADELTATQVDYWALGGRHQHGALLTGRRTAHYSGGPQGRQPQETQAHGCLVVDLPADADPLVRFVATDVARFYEERLTVADKAGRAELEKMLAQRVESIIASEAGLDRLIAWQIAASGEIATQLRRGSLGADLLAGLRQKYGVKSPAAWSWTLDVEPPQTVPVEWRTQQTMLGDFLRMVEHHREHRDEPLGLDRYGGPQPPREIQEAATLGGAKAREKIWAHVAALGVDLLRGEEARA